MDEEEKKKLQKAISDLNELTAKFQAGIIGKTEYDAEMTKVKATLTSLEVQIKEMNELLKKRQTAMSGLEDEKEKFSLGKFLCGAFLGKWADKNGEFKGQDNSHEYKVIKEFHEKIGKANEQTTTGGAGGYAIPPQAIMDVIERLYANTTLVKAGARFMRGLTGSPVYIPRHSGSTTAYWIGEGDAITNSKITDQQVSMTPKECAALVVVQNKLLELAASNPAIENLIVSDLEMQIALAVDIAGLRGAGSSSEPRGIANTSLINTLTLGADGDYFDFDDVIDMEGALDDDNALRGKLAFITHGKIKRKLKKTKIAQYSGDTGGQYVVFPMSEMNLKDALGYEMLTTSQLPTNLTKGSGTALSEVYFGNWDDLIIGQWGGLDIARSDSAGEAFERNQTKIRLIQMIDTCVRHAESFCLCNDAKTV